jgi:hypothetical protein
MYAYGRTLRREGELRLLALPAGADCEWYCVCNGPTPLATFKLLERAHSFFDAVCGAAPAAVSCGGRPQGCPSAADAVTDLATYRRRRGLRPLAAPAGDAPVGPSEERRRRAPGRDAGGPAREPVRG